MALLVGFIEVGDEWIWGVFGVVRNCMGFDELEISINDILWIENSDLMCELNR